MCPKSLRETHPDVCRKYPRFVEQYIHGQVEDPVTKSQFIRGWQSALLEALKILPSLHKIIFCVDKKGNAEKSWFVKYYWKVSDPIP